MLLLSKKKNEDVKRKEEILQQNLKILSKDISFHSIIGLFLQKWIPLKEFS
ncbi:hypothetical protein SAMD00020551_4324 [Mesobacillus selenatarsenatis SF-1]|uniref:Uncharacterized protein n=1 Tax=Mesobacillus selenatarsenatis (strain DSM 18680 / JCM 14380 / FERM P-15431 / SF-1) TaxID=1321606 RepID=A0A0A8XD96_MESS1|nr:hypothetical protein SAMD00020551_4324 [Mesobacillus selenatarsenatis SF-1]